MREKTLPKKREIFQTEQQVSYEISILFKQKLELRHDRLLQTHHGINHL